MNHTAHVIVSGTENNCTRSSLWN